MKNILLISVLLVSLTACTSQREIDGYYDMDRCEKLQWDIENESILDFKKVFIKEMELEILRGNCL